MMLHPMMKAMTITITPEQIFAATQKIANAQDYDAWQHTEAEWLAAVEHYLRCKVNDLLIDVDWHADKDHFQVERTCDHPNCYAKPADHGVYCAEHADTFNAPEATELTLPPAPHWAKGNGEIVQRRELTPEPNGDILFA